MSLSAHFDGDARLQRISAVHPATNSKKYLAIFFACIYPWFRNNTWSGSDSLWRFSLYSLACVHNLF